MNPDRVAVAEILARIAAERAELEREEEVARRQLDRRIARLEALERALADRSQEVHKCLHKTRRP